MGQPKDAWQDDEGQWWYTHKNGTRQRLHLATCVTCGREFPRHGWDHRPHCSDECMRKPCLRCGTEFRPSANSNAYCSVRCKMGPRDCPVCGTEFWPAKDKKRRYCSRECYYEETVPTGTTQSTGETGYVMVKVPAGTPGTKMAGNRGGRWMLQHRYVMQETLGRELGSHEHVHHINGDRTDNRAENLELWKSKSDRRQPFGVRATDYHCAGCRCFE